MTWLHGAWLGLLGLALLPTLIHLLSRRKMRVVPFTLVMLLEQSRRRTERNVRMRNLLLWLLRTLLVVALVVAFLGPQRSKHPEGAVTTPTAVVVVVDTTASMLATVPTSLGADRTTFDIAKDSARSALAALPKDIAVGVLACGARATVVAPVEFSRGDALAALDELTASYEAGVMSSCIPAAVSMARPTAATGAGLSAGPRAVRVLLASDGRASSVGVAAMEQSLEGVEMEWLAAPREAAQAVSNHAVVSVSTHARGSQELAVEASLWVAAGDPSVMVDARVQDQVVARATVAGSAQTQTRPFVIANVDRLAGDGPDGGRLSVVMPTDAFPIDDAVVLSLDAQTTLDVLIVDGAPETVPLRDEVHYLLQAIHQAGDRHAHIRERVVTADQLLPSDLASIQVVMLANVASVADVFAAALRTFVEAGGGLWITSGDQLDVAAYQANLDALLPARLRGAKELALLDDVAVVEPIGIARVRSDHPIFSSLSSSLPSSSLPSSSSSPSSLSPEAGIPGLGRVRTRALMLVEPNLDGRNADVLMSFSNDAPAMMERKVGAGRVLLLTTSIDRDWSDFAIRPGFLPFVETTVLYLANALVEPAPRLLRVGEPRSVRAQGANAFAVTLPNGEVLALAADSQGEAVMPTTAMPGPYQVSMVRGEVSKRVPALDFAVVVAAEESDFTPASDAALRASVPSGAQWRQSDNSDQPQPLWPLLVIVAVLLFALESGLLWQRGHRAAVQ